MSDKAYFAEYYRKHRQLYLSRAKARRDKARHDPTLKQHQQASTRRAMAKKRSYGYALMCAAKAQPCADCGVQYPAPVMQFDHVRGTKEFTISAKRAVSPAQIKSEIRKCDVVCANCHALRTFERKQKCS